MPTEEQLLQAEHDGLLTPEEQQQINELRDIGGIGLPIGLPVRKGKGATSGVKSLQPPVATPTPTSIAAPEPAIAAPSPAPAPAPESFTDALMNALARAGERQGEAVQAYTQAGRELFSTPGLQPRKIGRFALAGAKAAQPLYAPEMTVGEVAGETAARTGAVPLSPETGATVGSLVPGGVQMLPSLIRGGAKLVSPSLRATERAAAEGAAKSAAATTAAEKALEARRFEQAMAGMGQAGQMAARGPTGAEARGVVEGIGNRLAGTAGKTFEESLAAQPKALTLKPTKAVPETTAPSSLVDEFGRPVVTTTPAKAAKILTEKDYSKTFLDLRRTHERAGQAAIDFDRTVGNKLSKLGDSAVSRTLAKDPDVMAAIAAHATPAEMAIIQRAVEAGKPLSKMPYTAEQLEGIGRIVLEGTKNQGGRGIFSPLTFMGIGAGGLGAMAGVPYSGAGLVAIVTGRLALKAMDVALGSRTGVGLMRQLARVAPGTPDTLRIFGAIGSELAGPQRLQPPDQSAAPQRLQPPER